MGLDDLSASERPLDYVAPVKSPENPRQTTYYQLFVVGITIFATLLDWQVIGHFGFALLLPATAVALNIIFSAAIAGIAWLIKRPFSVQQYWATVFTFCVIGFPVWFCLALLAAIF